MAETIHETAERLGGPHDEGCPWREVGGADERERRLRGMTPAKPLPSDVERALEIANMTPFPHVAPCGNHAPICVCIRANVVEAIAEATCILLAQVRAEAAEQANAALREAARDHGPLYLHEIEAILAPVSEHAPEKEGKP